MTAMLTKAVVPDREWQEAVVIIDMLIIRFVVHAFFYLNSSISISWADNKTLCQFINVWRTGVWYEPIVRQVNILMISQWVFALGISCWDQKLEGMGCFTEFLNVCVFSSRHSYIADY